MPMPGTEAGDEAPYVEWEAKDADGNVCKYFGMRNAAGLKSGIVRTIDCVGTIEEATFFEDKRHGLSFWWTNNSYSNAFEANIFEHGEQKAHISWKSDWSECRSRDKELILKNGGLSLLKP